MNNESNHLAESHELYTLGEKHTPLRCRDTNDWLLWMNSAAKPEERTTLPNGRVLFTTFAGYPGERRESQPLTFVTVFKPEPTLPEFCVNLEWYRTWDEAKAAHARFVFQFTRCVPVQRTQPV